MKKKIAVLGGLILIIAVAFLLVCKGVVIPNSIKADKYQVRGVDVSSYQGDIDWKKLSSQGISFAFIKATEGSSHEDQYFKYNYREAQKAGLRVGAYHFFSYDSEGRTQAENFINTVEKYESMLPPVIDVEFYGDKESNPPDKTAVHEQMDIMVSLLEEHYGMKPIIYATAKSYSMYIKGDYKDCDIWIRNVVIKPRLDDGRKWTFWQYTDKETLEGYSGKERYIDMNVFCGSREEFEGYGM